MHKTSWHRPCPEIPSYPFRMAGLVLAIAWLAGCGAQETSDSEPATTDTSPAAAVEPWFRETTAFEFRHETGATGDLHLPEIMGSGAALFDADGDGRLDAYLINSAFSFGGEPETTPRNQLFLQQEDGTFRDATEASGLGDPGYGMGVAIGDIDNDGHDDVYLSNLGADRLYRNRGDGTFEDHTAAAGVATSGWSTSASFLDFDRDGDLDLYVTHYVSYDPSVRCFDSAGRHEYCGPTAFPGESDVLLRNEGNGTFTDVSTSAGIAAVAHAGLGVVCEDFDGDGWIDVYVANDADPNQLWINQGDGTFRDDALVLGASINAMGAAEAGMGVVAADFDNDLDFDLFMTHLEDESNTLYRNLGPDLGFDDVTASSGLATESRPFTGFGTAAFDAELDGDLDLVVANGRVLRSTLLETPVPAPWNDYAEPNLFFLGDGSGTFEPAPVAGGPLTGTVEITRGIALGDIDRDGDLDLLLSNTQGPARLYLNEAPRAGHWLQVEAIDPELRRTALGARIEVRAGGRVRARSLTSGFSYLSSSEAVAHFGLGEAEAVEGIDVLWPDGTRERFPGAAADQRIRLEKGRGESR